MTVVCHGVRYFGQNVIIIVIFGFIVFNKLCLKTNCDNVCENHAKVNSTRSHKNS